MRQAILEQQRQIPKENLIQLKPDQSLDDAIADYLGLPAQLLLVSPITKHEYGIGIDSMPFTGERISKVGTVYQHSDTKYEFMPGENYDLLK